MPSWSPDGQRIAFVSNREGKGDEVYVMDADGKNPHNLTNNPSYDGFSSWSPDGRRIAFTSNRGDEGYEIYVMDADGKNPRNLTNNPGINWTPDWFGPALVNFVSSW